MSVNTTVGQLLINQALPEDLRDYGRQLDKKGVQKLMAQVAERYPDQYAQILQGLMDASRSIGSRAGTSVSLRHLVSSKAAAAELQKLREANQRDIDDPTLDDETREKRIVARTGASYDRLAQAVMKEGLEQNSPYALQAKSGSRGNISQLSSLVGSDLLVSDHRDRPMPLPIYHSYAHGLDPAEYWASAYGTRKGMISVKFCLFAGEKVRMADGSARAISDIKAGEWVVGADAQGKTFPVQVQTVFFNGIREVREWHFWHRSIVATEDHQVLSTLRSRKNRRPLVVDTRPLRSGLESKSLQLFLQLPSGGDWEQTHYEPLASFLGLMAGDGCAAASAHCSLSFSCADLLLIDETRDIFQAAGFSITKAKGSPYNWRLVSTEEHDRLRSPDGRVIGSGHPTKKRMLELGQLYKRAHEKELPHGIWSWSDQAIWEYFGALFSCDGSMRSRGKNVSLVLAMTALHLLEELKELLLVRFGIDGRLLDVKMRGNMRNPQKAYIISHVDHVRLVLSQAKLRGAKRRQAEKLLPGLPEKLKRVGDGLQQVGEPWMAPTYDLEVDHPDHLFVLANGAIVSNSVADAGFLGKQLALAAQRQMVTSDRPAAHRLPIGLPVDLHDPDNEGAVLAVETAGYPPGTVLTARVLEDVRRRHQGKKLLIHSPLTSISEDGGLDQWSAGQREKGRLSDIGDNVGITAAQSISEPLSQGLLNCLVEGTEVLMADFSIRRIEEIQPGDMVMGATSSGHILPVRVSRWFDNGVQPCVRTSFRYGQRIVATLDSTLEHKCLVSTQFTNHSEQPLNHVPRTLPIGKTCRDLRILRSQGLVGDFGRTEERAYLLGMLLGDGCYTEAVHGVHFSCADKTMVERLSPYLERFNLRLKHLSAYYYRLSQITQQASGKAENGCFVSEIRNPARQLLDEYDCGHKYAHEKVVPAAVHQWDNRSVAAFIAGLIDTDGTVFLRKSAGVESLAFGFCSTSRALLDTVRMLLELRFGIYPAGTVELKPDQKGSRHAKHSLYTFHCSDRLSVIRFAREIPLLGSKREKVAAWVDRSVSKKTLKVAGSALRVSQEEIGERRCFDIEVDHPDHLFVLANGLIVSNSKHSAGVGGAKINRQGFSYINNLLQGPETFNEAGPLAPVTGEVTGVEQAPQGGHYLTIGEQRIYVRPGLNVTVKPGQRLEQGDDLTDGVPHPQDLVKYRGVGEARREYLQHVVEALRNSGLPVHRRNAESIVAGLINHVRVTDPDGYNDHLIDQVVPFNTVAANYRPRENASRLPAQKAIGKYLEEPVLHYTPGTRLTPKILQELQEFGVQDLDVHDDPPPFEPQFERLMTNTSHDPDWQTRLGGFYIGRSLLKGVHEGAVSDRNSTSFLPAVAQGAVSDRNSTSFLPAVAQGADFGKQVKTRGRY